MNREKLWELSDFSIILLSWFSHALSFLLVRWSWDRHVFSSPSEEVVCMQLRDESEVVKPDLMPFGLVSTFLWLKDILNQTSISNEKIEMTFFFLNYQMYFLENRHYWILWWKWQASRKSTLKCEFISLCQTSSFPIYLVFFMSYHSSIINFIPIFFHTWHFYSFWTCFIPE